MSGLSERAVIGGWTWAAFQYLFLPGLLFTVGGWLSMDEAALNFIYYCCNFCATVYLFGAFLLDGVRQALKRPGAWLFACGVGFCVCYACAALLGLLLRYAAPGFANMNDQAVLTMFRSRPVLMFVGTVFLVPVAEECLFRGLIFGRLLGAGRLLAYGLSAAAFAFVHVMGYLGSYDSGTLALCAVQYIPPALALAWAYQKSGSILAPIAIHAATNAAAFLLSPL